MNKKTIALLVAQDLISNNQAPEDLSFVLLACCPLIKKESINLFANFLVVNNVVEITANAIRKCTKQEQIKKLLVTTGFFKEPECKQ